MKCYRQIIVVFLISIVFTPAPPVRAGLGDIFKKVQEVVGGSEELSENRIIQGLKEALEIGTDEAVKLVSKTDGYYKNPKIKIPLPDAVRKVEKILRSVGFGSQVDAFEKSMNNAAEKAAPEARDIFWDTIKQMSFGDAKKILNGRDNEATLYFQEKTGTRLGETFKPIVNSAMSQVGVTRMYQEMAAKVKSIPFAGSLNMDLDQYVTDKALNGLFVMLADEERKIRQNPTARVTDLLKEVFKK